jgi:hypothetical protein
VTTQERAPGAVAPGSRVPLAVFAWLWVAVPFGYGLWQLLVKVVQLFGS